MVDTFWTTSSQTPPERVIGLDSPGDGYTDPVGLIRGADGGTGSATLSADAEALFPTWDADGTIISSRPTTYSASATGDEFSHWHSAHQLAWMAEYGTATTGNDGDGDVTFTYATFGTDSDAGLNLHVMLSADRSEVIILNYLEPGDIAKLSLEDQRALTLHPAWDDVVTARHLLTPSGGQTVAVARAKASALIDDVIDAIQSSDGYVSGMEATFESDSSTRATYWHYIFTEQLQIMQGELDAMAVFDLDVIEQRVADFSTRFSRVERIAAMTAEAQVTGESLPRAVNAVDGGASIADALDLLIELELQIYDLAVAAAEVISSGTYEGQVLDTPGMIFVLQTLTNYRKEAEAEAMSEDLDQRNALLADYEKMQTLVTATLTKYSSSGDTDEKKTIADAGILSVLEDEEQRTVAMFDSYWSALNGNTYHAYETEKDLDRPVEAMVDAAGSLLSYEKETWDALGLNLSEATGTLSRDNQEVMDEVNTLNSEKNRHYDLASSTLNKMTSILRSIVNS